MVIHFLSPLFKAPRAYVHLRQGLSDDPLRWTGLHIPLFAIQGLESLRQLPEPKEVPDIRENITNL